MATIGKDRYQLDFDYFLQSFKQFVIVVQYFVISIWEKYKQRYCDEINFVKSRFKKGKIITWKDDRGFGFIKPDDGGKTVFLHISALNRAVRRPKVGDTILYKKVIEPDGKVGAAKASIKGVPPRYLSTKQKSRKRSLLTTILRILIIAIVIELSPSRFPSPITFITKPGCNIKGNISIKTGRRLYHLSGMEDYKSTVIDPTKGEKWFCTESEAIENGWRKARR